jgi:hypothetical protein
LLAAHDAARDGVAAIEQARDGVEVAARQRAADARAGHALAVDEHGRDRLRGETEFGPECLQQGEVAGASLAEAEVRTDPHFARRQAAGQDLTHEVFGRHRGQACIEAQQADQVGAELAQSFELRARQGQARRRIGGGEEFARQRFEAQRDGGQAERTRTRGRVAHQCPMAEMEAVEGADADHAALGAQRPAFDVTEQPAHGTREYSGANQCSLRSLTRKPSANIEVT